MKLVCFDIRNPRRALRRHPAVGQHAPNLDSIERMLTAGALALEKKLGVDSKVMVEASQKEHTTYRLQDGCSTAELSRLWTGYSTGWTGRANPHSLAVRHAEYHDVRRWKTSSGSTSTQHTSSASCTKSSL